MLSSLQNIRHTTFHTLTLNSFVVQMISREEKFSQSYILPNSNNFSKSIVNAHLLDYQLSLLIPFLTSFHLV
jgi:hypothetical protein